MSEHETNPSAARARGAGETAAAPDGQARDGSTVPQNQPKLPGRPRTAEVRYRLLFEHNLAGVYCTALDGTILDCNESLAKMLGYASRDELMSHRALDLYLAPRDREAFLARLFESGMLTDSEISLRRRDGTRIQVLENVILLPDDEGALSIIQGTMVDITRRKQAEEVLRESERRYRMLASELRRVMQRTYRVREEERVAIAREIHDELGQALTALNMDLHWLRGRSWREAEATEARISSMRDLVNGTIRTVHRICSDLRPPILDDFGLLAALEWQAQEFEMRTGVRCRMSLPVESPTIPEGQSTAVFRIFQESLTNITRHAQATEATVTLEFVEDTLVLRVTDNGIGISEDQLVGPDSVGLAGMRERALHWAGQVEVSGIPSQGTTVLLHMPITKRGVEPEP
jgi:PAS domain S-box-containing protein